MDEKGIGSVLYDANKLSTSEDYRYTHFYCMRGQEHWIKWVATPTIPLLIYGHMAGVFQRVAVLS